MLPLCAAFQSGVPMQLTKKSQPGSLNTIPRAKKLISYHSAARSEFLEVRRRRPQMHASIATIPMHQQNAPLTLTSSTALNPNTPTKVLGGLALLLAALPAVCWLANPLPAGSNLMAKMFAGAVGGMTALSVCHPFTGEDLAAQGMLKGISTFSYNYVIGLLTTCSLGAKTCGLAGVALASLATGLVVAFCQTPLDSAGKATGDSLVAKLKLVASRGVFAKNGLFSGLTDSIMTNVAGFEAFFLSYSLLVGACPWLGVTLTGTAISGALSGVAATCASSLALSLKNFPSVIESCKTWWKGTSTIKDEVCKVASNFSSSAFNSSVLFVSYKAVLDTMI
eukprot:CAMPEP_0181290704 /NCGR_PEP_ID=MMETSP1101-20121128/1556_1 /TAXON_ID=46948 /ORGANISM="Rhodomonas abbreviata, Strain Caron Lab Isolate" /LENGTH=336 /DNA_ID=CAMNT_0023395007 /DNA_START=123 /DNA_END=1133 /DNA_ORIENTATION=+